LSVQEDSSQNLQLHFRYYLDENERVKYKIWGGSNEGQAIAPEVLFLIYHVHLDALRDAENYLRPIRGNRLGQLYANIQIDPDLETDKEKKRELAKKENWKNDSSAILKDFATYLSTFDGKEARHCVSINNIGEIFTVFLEDKKLNKSQLMPLLRIAIIGNNKGPDMN